MSAAPGALRGEIDFDWTEVDCFLRPQFVVLDGVAPGYGLLFLSLVSLYRAWGVDGFFAGPARQHFVFVDMVLGPLCGVDFVRHHPSGRDDIVGTLRAALEVGGAAIVPANLRRLPYFRERDRTDQAHYFVVTAFEALQDRFAIYDNLHLRADNGSTEYANATLSVHVLDDLARLYWDTHVDSRRITPHRESGYWILQLRPRGPARPRGEEEVLELIVSEHLRVMQDLDVGAVSSAPVDDRYLRDLRVAHESGESESVNPLVRAYLADANLALVHVKILTHALRRLRPGRVDDDLEAEVAELRKRSSTLRSKLFVKCLMAQGVSPAEWEEARSELVGLATRLRTRIASSLA